MHLSAILPVVGEGASEQMLGRKMNERNQGKKNKIWLAEEIWVRLEIQLKGLINVN